MYIIKLTTKNSAPFQYERHWYYGVTYNSKDAPQALWVPHKCDSCSLSFTEASVICATYNKNRTKAEMEEGYKYTIEEK